MTVGNRGTGDLTIDQGGVVTILTGAAIFGGMTLAGEFPDEPETTGVGTVLVDGAGSKLEVTGDSPVIVVGPSGYGTLTVRNNAVVETLDVAVAQASSAIGIINVESGAEFNLSGDDSQTGLGAEMQVGWEGTGTVNVTDATLSITGEAGQFPGFTLGFQPSGHGTLNVTGAAAAVTVQGVAPYFAVGEISGGALNVTNGASVTLDNGALDAKGYVGVNPDSHGTVLVEGAGSMLDAGSLLALGLDFDLNPGGAAELTVTNGGVAKATEIMVGPGAVVNGDGSLDGAVTNIGGFIAPGLSAGKLTIDGDLFFTDGVLEIEIGGLLSGEFDVLEIIGGAEFIGGTTVFSFIDGFLPNAGDFFEFLSAGALNFSAGAFDSIGVAPGFLFIVQEFVDPITQNPGLRLLALNDAKPAPEPTILLVIAGTLLLIVGGHVRLRGSSAPRFDHGVNVS